MQIIDNIGDVLALYWKYLQWNWKVFLANIALIRNISNKIPISALIFAKNRQYCGNVCFVLEILAIKGKIFLANIALIRNISNKIPVFALNRKYVQRIDDIAEMLALYGEYWQ